MDVHRLVPFAVLIALVLLFAIPAASQDGGQIVVNNADEVWETSVTVDSALVSELASVLPRVQVQYANELRPVALSDVPSTLRALLTGSPPRVIVQYANTLRRVPLSPGPGALQTALAQVASRVVIEYANENRHVALAFPEALLGDHTAPQISAVGATTAGSGSITVRWTTDEFADSEVAYGTAPGLYTASASDPFYVKQHEITITGLLEGATVYYRVRSTDQSGNMAQSPEQSHSPEELLYLPLILKH